jgi:transketolase
MRVMPNMVVIAPGDSVEAQKATLAIAASDKPAYLRLARDKTPVFSAPEAPFEIGRAYVLREGTAATLAGTGTMTYEFLIAAEVLAERGIDVEVLHVPTIKPLDEETILTSVRKTGRIVTGEEAQIAGGLGGAIAELLGHRLPRPLLRCGVDDRYGESGTPADLFTAFELTGAQLADQIERFLGQSFD